MPRLLLVASFGLILLVDLSGCSSEQGATIANPIPPEANQPIPKGGGKTKSAAQRPAVNVSPTL